MRFLHLGALFVLASLALTACDRPPLGTTASQIEVTAPDLSVVQLSPEVTLQISVEALRGVEQVRVNGVDAVRSDASGLWELAVDLNTGTNELILEATASGETTTESVYAVHLALDGIRANGALPEARTGHTLTLLPTGFLLAGGTGDNGEIIGTMRRGVETGASVSFGNPISLRFPRTGHSATPLADGRVLLFGGVSTATPSSAASFVRAPEVFLPLTGETRPVITRGVPVLRTDHSALLLTREGRQYLYVYGGRVPSTTGATASGSFDIFEIKPGTEADTLITFSPRDGVGGILDSDGIEVPLADPTQIIVRSGTTDAAALLTGISARGFGTVARRITYRSPGANFPFDIDIGETEAPLAARSAADADRIGSGLALLAGGMSPLGETLGTLEVYADVTRRFFSVPVSLDEPRSGHTVTLLPSGRILVLGGHDASGRPLRSAEVLSF